MDDGVFDSATALVGDAPFIAADTEVGELTVLPLMSRPRRTDVVISARESYATVSTAVVAFDGVLAQIVYSRNESTDESVHVAGAVPRQHIVVSGSDYPGWTVNSRGYEVRVAGFDDQAYLDGPFYRVVGDSRGWAGLDVIMDDAGLVVRNAFGPAAGRVRRGDVLLAARGATQAASRPSRGDTDLLAVETGHAGDVVTLDLRRGGRRLQVPVTLESWLEVRSDASLLDLRALFSSGSRGVRIDRLVNGPLSRAGVRVGDEILSVGDTRVRRPAQLMLALDDGDWTLACKDLPGLHRGGSCRSVPMPTRLTVRRHSATFEIRVTPLQRDVEDGDEVVVI